MARGFAMSWPRRATLSLACALALASVACSNDGNSGTGGSGGSGSGGSSGVGPCVERPGELPRPPKSGLPCDLFPPTAKK